MAKILLFKRRTFATPGFRAVLVVMPLAAFSAIFFWDGGTAERPAQAAETSPITPSKPVTPSNADTLSAHFPICSGPKRITCIVDGDTFWFEGEKIRIADIDTPEISSPKCAAEADMGAQATDRLQELMNAGTFTLTGAAYDRYGRSLRTVMRNGKSLGTILVEEGLARQWNGPRKNWC